VVESHVELGDMPVVMVFEVGEASSRVAAVWQLKDVEVMQCARVGDRAMMVFFEVREASSRVARELEDDEATRRNAARAWELK
jgi:hypothetical protein